ncbi:unnamed protein product, partial [Mesorhabditis spiculigera]
MRGTGLGYGVIVDYNEALQLLTLKITCVPQPDQAIKSIKAQLDKFTLTEAIIRRSKYIAANIFYTKMMTGPQRQAVLVTQLLRRDTGKKLKNQQTNKNWAPVGNESYTVPNIDDINSTWLWPVCDGVHWWLYVVQPSSGTVQLWDSLFNESDEAVYLKRFETAERRLEELWPQNEWRLNYRKICDQTDGSTCGVWVCVYADAIVGGVEPRATMGDMPHWRERILWALVTGRRPHLPEYRASNRSRNTQPNTPRTSIQRPGGVPPRDRAAAKSTSRSRPNQRSPSTAVHCRKQGNRH